MNRISTSFMCLLFAGLQGCEQIGDKESPQISRVYTAFAHFHPSYIEKDGVSTATNSIMPSVEFRIADETGIADLKEVRIFDASGNEILEMLDRDFSTAPFSSFYDAQNDLFSATFADVAEHRFDYETWQVEAKDLQGYTEFRDFDYTVFDGDAVTTEEFIYSPDNYLGADTVNGIPAMEVMEIATNSLDFTQDTVAETFTVTFRATDVRAKHYGFWFHLSNDLNRSPTFRTLSSEIGDNFVIPNQVISITLPWSDLPYNPSGSLMNGVHVVLYDEEIDTVFGTGFNWFHQMGISEYIPLTP